MLWARSGNRCALCKIELVSKPTPDAPTVILGEECHIISARGAGPRHAHLAKDQYDAYENLILLCANHHTQIDSAVPLFSTEAISLLKGIHEEWVRRSLQKDAAAFANPDLHVQSLARLVSGKAVLDIVCGSHAFLYDYPDDLPNDQSEIVGSFLQDAQDYGDILTSEGIERRVSAGNYLTERIDQLLGFGILLFGGHRAMRLRNQSAGTHTEWQVSILLAVREDNPAIVGDFIITATPKTMRPF